MVSLVSDNAGQIYIKFLNINSGRFGVPTDILFQKNAVIGMVIIYSA